MSSTKPPHTDTLHDRVAWVAGATRGGGLGIARVLGEAGATVWVSGRTERGGVTPDGLPGTVEDAAEAVSAAGGRGLPLVVDHSEAVAIDAAAERIFQMSERLDLLVCNVWGGYEGYAHDSFGAPFWEQPPERWYGMFDRGLRAHLWTVAKVVPAMREAGRGLVVCTTGWDHDKYLGNLYYDVSKAALHRAVAGMAHELGDDGPTVLALTPGFMRTERVLQAYESHPFDLSATESTEYVGRAVAALAADPEVAERHGGIFRVGDLAEDYGFVDVDGRRIPAFEIPELEPQR